MHIFYFFHEQNYFFTRNFFVLFIFFILFFKVFQVEKNSRFHGQYFQIFLEFLPYMPRVFDFFKCTNLILRGGIFRNLRKQKYYLANFWSVLVIFRGRNFFFIDKCRIKSSISAGYNLLFAQKKLLMGIFHKFLLLKLASLR